MADWTSIDPNTLLPGEPWTSAKALAAFENVDALAEGAAGAPSIGPAVAKHATAVGVGAYVFARGPSTAFGATAAGSALTPSGGISSLTTTSSPGSGTWATGVGSALSGTWRCMGFSTASFNSTGAVTGAAGTGIGATLWVRIA